MLWSYCPVPPSIPGNVDGSLIYEKYRCRACKRYATQAKLHEDVSKLFSSVKLDNDSLSVVLTSLEEVWKLNEGDAEQEKKRLWHKISSLT